MTEAVAPPPAPTVPVYPALGSGTFNQEAYTYATAMPAVSLALGALAANVVVNTNAAHGNAVQANLSAQAAAQSEMAASNSVAAAAAAAGAVRWVTGTNYGIGVVVWSPVNGFNYRRRVAGVSNTDPSADAAGWWLLGAPLTAPIQLISANTTAQTGVHYVIGAALTLTLPPAPSLRDVVQLTDLSGMHSVVVDPNGTLIRGQTGPLTLDVRAARCSLIYSGVTKGWV